MTTPNGLPLSTDIQAMQNAQSIFDNALQDVNAISSSMQMQQETLAANWQGETASAFGNALTNFLGDLSKVQNALSNLMQTMSTNTGIYSNTNEESQSYQQAFAQGLDSISALPGLQA